MEQLIPLVAMWRSTLVWMAGLAAAFFLLTRLMPCNPGMAWWKDRRALTTDLIYWFVVPIFLRIFSILMLYSGFALVFMGQTPDREIFNRGFGPMAELPLLTQCVLILLGQDIILYWIHRIFHGRAMWRYHAVHHSSETLDWVSTQRFHPINSLLAFSLVNTLTMMAGFSPAALVALAPFNTVYSAMVHANLNWTFGPLKYVFASPVFHRWHHTHPSEGGNRNFAPTFPILDVVFGTFYMPAGKLPQHYGVTDPNFPDDFWGQFMYPFRK